MAIKIGYCASPGQKQNAWFAFDPTYHPVREMPLSDGPLRRCPASIEYLSSAFNVHVPYDFAFTVVKDVVGNRQVVVDYERTTINERIAHQVVDLSDADHGTIQINVHPFWVFISDEPGVVMSVGAAHNQTNPHPIRGQFNIFQWFRPVSYAIDFEYGKQIVIEKNKPIYQVKFWHPKEKNFSLEECTVTPEVFEHHSGQYIRSIIKYSGWDRIFKYAEKRRPAKVLKFRNDDQK
jgi:hypothetical protein